MTDLELLIRDKYDGDAGGVTVEDKERLARGEPLSYVIGWLPFLGVRVDLSSRALIPRPETEWWTEKCITHLNNSTLIPLNPSSRSTMIYHSTCSVLDLCAGSGAIGLAVLKHCPNAHVTFAELDANHLLSIERSIEDNGLDASHARLVAGDLFENLAGDQFDIIVCNPPYVPSGRELEASVRELEPSAALFSGGDGLELIRRIAREAPAHLIKGRGEPASPERKRGELWLEADIENIEEARRLLVAAGASRTDMQSDLYGRPRLVVAYY